MRIERRRLAVPWGAGWLWVASAGWGPEGSHQRQRRLEVQSGRKNAAIFINITKYVYGVVWS